MRKLSKALKTKIDFINEKAIYFYNQDDLILTYDGGTFPNYLHIEYIEANEKFVYIKIGKYNDYPIEKRYTINKDFGFGSFDELKYIINLISKEYKKALKNL